jgi:hypothetical protein
MVTPASEAITVAIAIESLTVTWDGSNNKITAADILGQTTVSTTASDYMVVLLGPTVSKTDTSSTSGHAYLGYSTGTGLGTVLGAGDNTDQNLINRSISSSLVYPAGPNWADGTTNPETTIVDQLDKIITDLSTTDGTDKIQGNVYTSDNFTLAADRLEAQLNALVEISEDVRNKIIETGITNWEETTSIMSTGSHDAYDIAKREVSGSLANDVFCVAGSDGTTAEVRQSNNGLDNFSATNTLSGTCDEINCILYDEDNDVFVAGGRIDSTSGAVVQKSSASSFGWGAWQPSNMTGAGNIIVSITRGVTNTMVVSLGNIAYAPDNMTWTAATVPDFTGYKIVASKSSSYAIAVGKKTGALARVIESTDNGATWTTNTNHPLDSTSRIFSDACYDEFEDTFYVMAEDSLHRTSDNGATWTDIFPTSAGALHSVIAKKKTILCGGTDNIIYFSLDNGSTWDSFTAKSSASNTIKTLRCFDGRFFGMVEDDRISYSLNTKF